MEEIPYEKRLHAAAWKDFRGFWSDYRWWLTIVGFFNLPLVVQIIRGIHTMFDFGVACAYGLGSLIFSLLGSYAIAMRRGAESLDTCRKEQIGQRDKELSVEMESVRHLKCKRSVWAVWTNRE